MHRRACLLLLLSACGSSGKPAGLTREQLVDACARLVACRPPSAALLGVTVCAGLGEAARRALPGSFVAAARCAEQAAGDCAAVLACYNGDEPSTGCDQTAPAYCLDANRSWQCLAGVALERDCKLDGLTCVPADSAAVIAACGEAACDASFVPHCDGDRLVSCVAGVATPALCAEGAACKEGATGATCVGLGPPCADTPPRCDGETTLVTCIGQADARRECAAGGYQQKCGMDGGGMPACVGLSQECTAATFVDRCNGARLEYCQDGRVQGVDCDALGFIGCTIGDPVAGVPSRCKPSATVDLDAGVPDADVPDAAAADAAASDGAP